jgi:hypothetical protein
MQCALEEGGSDQTNLMRWREATRELFLKITVKCNCRVLVSAMAGLKRAAPSIETSDEVPLFASRNVDSCDKPRIEVLTAWDRVEMTCRFSRLGSMAHRHPQQLQRRQ